MGSLKWWEKTVEYLFVISAAQQGVELMAPLAGNQERASDALLQVAKKFVLIEFKLDEGELDADKAKFRNYEEAKDFFLPRGDVHHLFVYGEEVNLDGSPAMVLRGKTYFSRKLIDSIPDALGKGKSFEEFFQYIEEFTKRKLPRGGGGGESALDHSDYAIVVGVSLEGEALSMSLSSFVELFKSASGAGEKELQLGDTQRHYLPPR